MTNWRFLALATAILAVTLASTNLCAQMATAPASRPAVRIAPPSAQQVEAELRANRPVYQVGQPVWVEFVLRNLTAEPVALAVPGIAPAEVGPPTMGLPVPHVFSGSGFTALNVERLTDQSPVMTISRRPSGMVPPLILAPYATVGLQVDATQWYPVLRQAGEYRLQWSPYGGQLVSNSVTVHVMNWKDAVIITDLGDMRVRLFYDKAPKTVERFVDLAAKGFYDNRNFHRLLPGFIAQGGSPTGDGTGMAPDGVRLKAELNSTVFQRGTVAMALAGTDPDSASCQFFISLAKLPEFDGHYTAFGELIGTESFDTLAKIEQIELTKNGFGEVSQPAKPLRIHSIILENAPRPAATSFTSAREQTVSPGMFNSH